MSEIEKKTQKYQGNPNPKAKVGFVIFYPFQYFVFKNVYENLSEESEFIVDFGAFFPTKQPEELTNDVISLLLKENVHFRILNYDDYYYVLFLEKFFDKYSSLVSLWHRGCVSLNCNLNRKKINMPYGAGKELTMFGFWKRNFDLILAYGERDQKFYSLLSKSVIVGNPKYDDWFNGKITSDRLSFLNQINKEKKTVLYLPTHSDLCSIDQLASALKKISNIYNIIVKLHYYTPREEPERVKMLEHTRIIILKDNVDLLKLLKISDVVISDNSSAIFDAILADKPILTTDFLSKDFFDIEHRKIKAYRRGLSSALTYSGSIEQKIKKDGLILAIKNPDELGEKIKEALTDDVFYKEARANLRKKLFSFNDGGCGKRAAIAIKDLLAQKESSERPFLYHAIENFQIINDVRPISEKKSLDAELQRYKKALFEDIKINQKNKCLFSVIVWKRDSKETRIKITLKSLIMQKFPINNFEIITEDINNISKILDDIKKELLLDSNDFPQIHLLKKDKHTSFFLPAIKKANGLYACFIENGCIAPANWLSNFLLIYNEFPQLGGIGGSIIYNDYSIYTEFYYQALARKLGIHREYRYLKKMFFFKSSLFIQNPSGDLRNMSYRMDLLNDFIKCNIVYDLTILNELEIKKFVIDRYEIGYTPITVRDSSKINFREFCLRNFSEGVLIEIFRRRNSFFYTKTLKISFLSPFILSLLNIIDGYSKVRLTLTIFLASFFRLLGRWYCLSLKIKKTNY